MPIDVELVHEVISRAGGCRLGMIEVAFDSIEFDALRIAVQAGHLEWVANRTARITQEGRAYLAPTPA